MLERIKNIIPLFILIFFGMCIGAVSYSYASIHREMNMYGMTSSAIEGDLRACEAIHNTKCKVNITIVDTKIKLK